MSVKLIIGSAGSGKTNVLFNLISQEIEIDKISLYTNDRNEAKFQLLINKQEISGLKHFNDSKAFIEYSNDMDDINYEDSKQTRTSINCI